MSPDRANEESAKAGSSLKGVRVLLAEDNAINQKLLLVYLERMWIETVLAENSRIVLEKFAPNRFDLILMDVAMPVMDGISATRHLRARWTSDELPPIIVLTAHVMDAIEEDASSVGVQTVLSKPIPFDELRIAIELVVSNSKERQPDGAMPPSRPGFISLMSDDIAAELQENFTPDKLTDLVAAYLDDSRQRLIGIQKLHASGQIDAARREAHSLKGSSRLLGFDPVGDSAAEIEMSMTSMNVGSVDEKANAISDYLERLERLIA